MPAKKTTKTAEVVETETKTVKKTTAKKAAAEKKPAAKKTEKTTETKTTAKKTAAKKETAKKETAKKETVKKTASKKTTTKKPAAKKPTEPEVVKMSVKDYEDKINWKKGEANGMNWLYIEINADDLLTEFEAGIDNLTAACEAILNCMLEGDAFIVEPAEENKVSPTLTVRYYCDNLSEDRRKYFDR